MTFLGWLRDPFTWLSDLQLGHLAYSSSPSSLLYGSICCFPGRALALEFNFSSTRWATTCQEQNCVEMGVSKNRGKTHQIMNFNRVFHYKPSILGYPYFWKHPNNQSDPSNMLVSMEFRVIMSRPPNPIPNYPFQLQFL